MTVLQPAISDVVEKIVQKPHLHAKWLNTLSLMENTGARKIAAFEDEQRVTESILKHAAEEFRHAYFLKRQIRKVATQGFEDYSPSHILAPPASRNYLKRLDLHVCRYVKNVLERHGDDLRSLAYLLTTYAIEIRADEVYPIYQEVLTTAQSAVNVRSIIVEEEGHLEEMTSAMQMALPDWERHAKACERFESELFFDWLRRVSDEIDGLQSGR